MAVVKKTAARKERPAARRRAPRPAAAVVRTGARGSKVTKAALERATVPGVPRWDVFISHSSLDKGTATRLAQDLQDLGVRVWVDWENLVVGDLLPVELGEAIRDSLTFVLLWSASTDSSAWVPQELQAALAVGRPILLCRLDGTPFDHHRELDGRFWCDLGSSYEAGLARLRAALAERKTAPGEAPGAPIERAPTAKITEIHTAQMRVLDEVERRGFERAADLQARLDPVVEDALARWPRDPLALSCAGYHRKNAVLISRRGAARALTAEEIGLLDDGARLFHAALASEPGHLSALNGLASVEATRGNLEMAEHYCLRALQQARHRGLDYAEAKSDLELIRAEKLRRAGREAPPPAQAGARVELGAVGPTASIQYRGAAVAIPEERRAALTESLRSFASHLGSMGLPGAAGRPLHIEIRPDAPYEAAYEPGSCAIVMRPVWAFDPSVLLREYAHHALLHAAGARSGAVDGALESGVADYLPCSFAGDPVMGGVGARVAFGAPHLRDLDTHESMNRYPASAPPQHRGLVWGGALWQLRKRAGAAVVDPLVAGAWLEACAGEQDFARTFARALRRKARALGAGLDVDIRRELAARKIGGYTRLD